MSVITGCVKVEAIQTSSPATVRWSSLMNSSLRNNGNPVVKSMSASSASVSLARNAARDLHLVISDESKKNSIGPTSYPLSSVSDVVMFRKFLQHGKLGLKLRRSGVIVHIWNVAPTSLVNFAQTLAAKLAVCSQSPSVSTGAECANHKPVITKRAMTKARNNFKTLGGAVHVANENVSPLTSADMKSWRQAERSGRGLLKVVVPDTPPAASQCSASLSSPNSERPSRDLKRKRLALNDCDSPLRRTKTKLLKSTSLVGSLTDLNKEQRIAMNMVTRGGINVFITGGAGTGKSFLIRQLIRALPPDSTVVTASTGVAAFQVGGMTLHAFASFGSTSTIETVATMLDPGSGDVFDRNRDQFDAVVEKLVANIKKRRLVWDMWRQCRHLIVDEISMVDPAFFVLLEAVASRLLIPSTSAKSAVKPFGGIQFIAIGDFFQLPPVSRSRDNTRVRFCFETDAWRRTVNQVVTLQTTLRQKFDDKFVSLLNSIRLGKCSAEEEAILAGTQTNYVENLNGGDHVVATKLCTHTDEVRQTNQTYLTSLIKKGATMKIFCSTDTAGRKTVLDNVTPVEGELKLAIGAEVMLVKNSNTQSGLVNGARGRVVGFEDVSGWPRVAFYSQKDNIHSAKIDNATTVTPEIWMVAASPTENISRKQIPLRLAWAISIHKSQGLTLDHLEVSLSRVFECGQAYVALSRVRSLAGLRITQFSRQCIKADARVVKFYRQLEDAR